MQNFVRVTKDNTKRDRGFIAIDAICSVFESQEDHNTQIMTMDGMWYDVVDDIEQLYSVCENSNTVCREKDTKSEFIKNRRMQSSALSENSGQAPKSCPRVVTGFKRKRTSRHSSLFDNSGGKKLRGSMDFSPGGEEGRCCHNQNDENMSNGE